MTMRNRTLVPFLLLAIAAIAAWQWKIPSVEAKEAVDADPEEKARRENPRIIGAEELASKIGKDGGDIWLAVLGEVYDVTVGKDYYGEGTSYSFFAGKDASPCFASGQFNDEGMKANLDDFEVTKLGAIEGWREFYEGKPEYPFVGITVGRFYDEEGKPTAELETFKARYETALAIKEAEKKRKAEAAKKRKEEAKKTEEEAASKEL